MSVPQATCASQAPLLRLAHSVEMLSGSAVHSSRPHKKPPAGDVAAALEALIFGVRQDLEALPNKARSRIHDIRVRLKKFRAILRIGRDVVSPASFKRTDTLARDLKDLFANTRDTQILKGLLREIFPNERSEHLIRALGLSRRSATGALHVATSRAFFLCAALAAMIPRGRRRFVPAKQAIEAWARSHRAARRAMRRCVANPDNDLLFHVWRKRVKTLTYQSVFLGFAPGKHWTAPRARKLAAVLGRHHDFAVLAIRLGEHGASASDLHSVEQAKADAASRALELGERLLTVKTGPMSDALAAAIRRG